MEPALRKVDGERRRAFTYSAESRVRMCHTAGKVEDVQAQTIAEGKNWTVHRALRKAARRLSLLGDDISRTDIVELRRRGSIQNGRRESWSSRRREGKEQHDVHRRL
jgi:hypothetical protein